MKKEMLILTGFILFFFTLSITSAALCSNPNQTILTLYSPTNSHAAVYNSSYNDPNYAISICYDNIFNIAYNTTTDPWTCNGTSNRILNLYSLTNSHVSQDASTGYPINICYGDLSCAVKSACNLTDGEKQIASISSLTNAHISIDDSYANKICCKRGEMIVSQVVQNNTRNITVAEWVNSTDASYIVSPGGGFGKKANIYLYGRTVFFNNSELLLPIMYDLNASPSNVHNNSEIMVINNESQSTQFNFFNVPQLNSSVDIGDWVYFKLRSNDSIEKDSPVVQILNGTIFAPFVTNDCSQFNDTSASVCESHMLDSSGIAVDILTPVGDACSGGRIDRCNWNASTRVCGAIEEAWNANVFQGSCTTTYNDIEGDDCSDGKREVSLSVQTVEGQCTGPQLCDSSRVVEIPCRDVALLPFFTLTNIIIVAALIILVYLFIGRKRKK